jgi:hypothetical protein
LKKTAVIAGFVAVVAVAMYLYGDGPQMSTGKLLAPGGPVAGPDGRVSPVSGGRLTVAYRSEPKTFNRLVSPQSAEDLVARLTQATLLRLDRTTGELEPRLPGIGALRPTA